MRSPVYVQRQLGHASTKLTALEQSSPNCTIRLNLGVEAGQALVVALLLPILVWMRGSRWERRAVQTASCAVAQLGFIWFVERLFLV